MRTGGNASPGRRWGLFGQGFCLPGWNMGMRYKQPGVAFPNTACWRVNGLPLVLAYVWGLWGSLGRQKAAQLEHTACSRVYFWKHRLILCHAGQSMRKQDCETKQIHPLRNSVEETLTSSLILQPFHSSVQVTPCYIHYESCISRDPEGRYLKSHHCAVWVYRAAYSLELLFAWAHWSCVLLFRHGGLCWCSMNSVTASSSWCLIHSIKATWTSSSQNVLHFESTASLEHKSCPFSWDFCIRHSDKYLNGFKEMQTFIEVFVSAFSFWVLWGCIHCQLQTASPPPLPRLSPGSTGNARYWSQHHISQLFCYFGVHLPRSSWSPGCQGECLTCELIHVGWPEREKSLLQSYVLTDCPPPSLAIRSTRVALWKS